ncbi:MAG: hypothetical protein ACI351_03650 [Candidatus Avelusimicrobium sp.]|uniref:hypothetical protein n=1 Tax=Candidatus Avelusimicrobium sp. TaxID=3048833 RepID=UPI003F1157B8
MKKIFSVVFTLLSSCVFAEEMQFVTVLSSPVGSFNRLEAVDYSDPAQGTTVNFCTKIGTGGKVQLKGNNNVDIENTNLSPNTTLGRSNAGDYVLQKITLNSAGELEGSRLLSKVVNVSGQGVGKSNNLYGTTLTVAGAKATTLNVNNGASQITAQHAAADMVWSNEYQDDAACNKDKDKDKESSCANQYLLKSKGASSGEDDSGDDSDKERCITGFTWTTFTTPDFGAAENCTNTLNKTTYYTTDMKCNESEPTPIYSSDLPMKGCTEGAFYLITGLIYSQLNANNACVYGYYCAKCTEVTDSNNCAAAAPKGPGAMSYIERPGATEAIEGIL